MAFLLLHNYTDFITKGHERHYKLITIFVRSMYF